MRRDFEKFDRDFNRAERVFWLGWVVAIAIITAAICGGGFVVYKLLIYFGVM